MSDAERERLVAGWYGKMPSLGDFASRRLPGEFIEAWDDWLQRSLTASRASLGEGWMETYLTSPIWRFALMPSVCGASGWVGVMMPSVDKVGRYFPLTLGVPIDPRGEIPGSSPAAQVWYAELERIALRTLDAAFGVEDLEQELAEHPYPQAELGELRDSMPLTALIHWWAVPEKSPQTFGFPELSQIADGIRLSLDGMMRAAAAGKTLWWSAPPIGEPVVLHCCTGLPAAEYFSILLHGVAASPASSANSSDLVE